MDNIGEILKNTRLDKGLSLEQVEEATSIRKIYLAAIETGDYTCLLYTSDAADD